MGTPTGSLLDEPPTLHELEQPAAPPIEPPATNASRAVRVLFGLVVCAVIASGTALLDGDGWWEMRDEVTRGTSAFATVAALLLLTWRAGGRYVIVGLASAVVLAVVVAFPEPWSLSGASVAAGVTFGLLGMVLTRPATGFRALRELLISCVIGFGGAAVIAGFVVDVRPYRLRVIALTLTLILALALAWRLGYGTGSLGRRGAIFTSVALFALVTAVAYAAALRAWGSGDFLRTVTDLQDAIKDTIGAVPRFAEALVGFPALIWGVAIRARRRQGWWLVAFGSLGAAGIATGFLSPDRPFSEDLMATADSLVIGIALGLLLLLLDRVFTAGHGRRTAELRDLDVERPEVGRFAPLL